MEKKRLPRIDACLGTLRKAGYAAHLVGGCVRDLLVLATEPSNFLWTSKKPALPA